MSPLSVLPTPRYYPLPPRISGAILTYTERPAGKALTVTMKSAVRCTGVAGLALSSLIMGCQNDAELGSSNRGVSSQTSDTSVENAYLVPTFVPGACAIQYGDTAHIRFTATNNRDIEEEQLLSITTDAADSVRVIPTNRFVIPPNSSITTGYPTSPTDGGDTPLKVMVDGLAGSVRPGVSVDVTFDFELAGPIEVRTPVEACPAQSDRMR